MPVLRVNPQGFLGSRVLRGLAWLLRGAVALLSRSCRIEVVAGHEHVAEILRRPRGRILVFWHNRAILGACFLRRTLFRRGPDLTLLASSSQDGELVAHVARQWKLRVVRGSAGKGGREALLGLHRAIVKEGATPVLVPDGPLGPLYEFKLGVAVLAQMAKVEIVPFGIAASGSWRLGSWDRLIVPKPFSRIAVVAGAPQSVPRGLDAAALEKERCRLEKLLADLTRSAESAARRR